MTNYKRGDFVFAKLKGARHWPAKVTETIKCDNNKTKYKILFFGDNTTATVKNANLAPYYDNIQSYGTPMVENFKNKKFNTALKEAELAFNADREQTIDAQTRAEPCQINENYDSEQIQKKTKLFENKTETNTLSLPQPELEDIHTKIKHFKDIDDLETSLTLAAEAGNVLLAENSKLRQDLHDLTLRNSLLAKQITDQHNQSELAYQAKIEELEAQNEALHRRNTLLTDTLSEIENQLSKEKQLQSALVKTFEEQDTSKEIIICKLEGKIKQLENTIKNLNNDRQRIDHSRVTAIDAEVQTVNIETPKQKDILQILVELTKLKCRQDHVESTIRTLQNNSRQQDQANTTQEKLTTPNCFNKARKKSGSKKENYFSVSLQVAKNKEACEQRKNKDTNLKKSVGGKIKEFGTFRVQNSPPMTATRLTDRTYEEFLTEHLKEISTKTETTSACSQIDTQITNKSHPFLEETHLARKNI